jgi:hypothetical protein
MKITLIAAIVLALTGCASSPQLGNVIPQAGGVYQVAGAGSTSDIAMKSALYTAETTCKPLRKRHIVTGQKTLYKGTVSEDTNRTVNNAAQVLATVTGRWVPTLSSDDDYQITLTFMCEA